MTVSKNEDPNHETFLFLLNLDLIDDFGEMTDSKNRIIFELLDFEPSRNDRPVANYCSNF